MKLRMTWDVAQKVAAIVETAPGEVGWWGTLTPIFDTAGQLAGAQLLDILIPKQTVSSTTADVEDTGDAFSVMDELTAAGREAEIPLLRFWGHSHVNMGTTPSGTDRSTWTKMATNNPDAPSVTAFAIHNKRGETYAEVHLNVPGLIHCKWEAQIEIVEQPMNPHLEWATAEYAAKCSRRSLHTGSGHSTAREYWGYGDDASEWGGWEGGSRWGKEALGRSASSLPTAHAGRAWLPGETYRDRRARLAREDREGAAAGGEVRESPPKAETSLTALAHRAVTPQGVPSASTPLADAASVVDPLAGSWHVTSPPNPPQTRASKALQEEYTGGPNEPSLEELAAEAKEALGGDLAETASHIHTVPQPGGWLERLFGPRGWAPESIPPEDVNDKETN